MENSEPIEFFDSHFHTWNTENGLSDATTLPPVRNSTVYLVGDYEKEWEPSQPTFRHCGGVGIEVMSACFPDRGGSDHQQGCIDEHNWLLEQLPEDKYVVVASVALEAANHINALPLYKEHPRVVGVRQVTNSKPDLPRNGALGNLLENTEWRQGFGKLAEANLLFELNCNPWQLEGVIGLMTEFPGTVLVIEHLSNPSLDDLRGESYWNFLETLSKVHEKIYMKISKLWAIQKDWDTNEFIIDSVLRIINIFGTDRCFFGSNFPVDLVKGEREGPALLQAYKDKIVARLEEGAEEKLFSQNAKGVYARK